MHLFRVPVGVAIFCVVAFVRIHAAMLSDPEVDAYNVRVGTQTFAGLYQFTTNTLLVETADAIRVLGSDVIKMYHGPEYARQYRITLPVTITNLTSLARDEPSCRQVLDMPFRHFIMWAYPFSNYWPFDGYSATERANEYRELFDLTRYFLTNYNNSGKTFYLGHWEGDWYLLPNYNTATNPTPTAIQGMIDWLNNRQKAVDDAKNTTPHSNVDVFNYAEVNRVLDATSGNSAINQRVINRVVPYVTNLDFVSYSSYDVMDASISTLKSTLDYMQSMLPTNKASVISGERLWIGEYGWGALDNLTQEQKSRAYLQRLLSWNPGPRFILFWEMYNNEANRAFWLIDSNNVKMASYYLHERFLNQARLLTAQFKERNGRLPSESEFGPLVTPMLGQPFPPPTSVSVQNATATLIGAGAAVVSGTLTQGLYGAEGATVRVFFGRQDGGKVRDGWEHDQLIAVNTNFNPATFTATLTNLPVGTNYFFRFYATNSSGEVWAPATSRFTTAALNPADFGSRFRLVLSGYNGVETLLNFPVLVKLSTDLPGFSYRHFASGTGGDLRFADEGGLLPLPFEIDEWNTNGVSSVWVRVPRLAGTNNSIWAYWGNPLATGPPPSSTNGNVWSDDHLLVYHLKEFSFPYPDSALLHPALSGNQPISSPGVVGRGVSFDGATEFLNPGVVGFGDSFTLSVWVKPDLTATNIQTVWANKNGGYATSGFALFINSYQTADQKLLLETGNGTSGAAASTATGVVQPAQWHLVTAAVDRSAGTASLYVDGTDVAQAAVIRPDLGTNSMLNLGRFTGGAFYFKGAMDEARIENSVRSADWVRASWMTVASNTAFASYLTVQQTRPALSLNSNRGSFSLAWPASGVGFALWTTTNLAPPIDWKLVQEPPILTNTQWQVLLSADATNTRFYQLQSLP
jgi:hypothetical protein